MNKTELIINLSNDTGLSKADCEMVIDSLSTIIMRVIATEDSLRLGEVGVISGYTRPPKVGRNPSTGEKIYIPEKTGYPKMKFSKKAKE